MGENESLKSVSDRFPDDLNTSVDLVHRAQRGDDLALNDLIARYQERLHRIVCIRLGARLKQHVESVDIVQETFAVAFQKLGDFELRSHASILQWLARIAENRIRDANDYGWKSYQLAAFALRLSPSDWMDVAKLAGTTLPSAATRGRVVHSLHVYQETP